LHQYLAWGYVPDGRSIYRDATRVYPGHSILLGRDCGSGGSYFTTNASEGGAGDDAAARARRLVNAAVARQMVSDVPLGAFLSGGIDSSVIVAAMRAAARDGQPVHTFTIRFDDPRYDEGGYATAVAKHLGTDHHEFLVRPNAAEDLPRLAYVFGEPFGDSSALPTHYLSRETRRFVTVAISGDGGDELFGGYDRYAAMAIGHRLRRVPRPILQLADVAARGIPGTHPKSAGARLRRLTSTLSANPESRYAGYLRIFGPATLSEILPRQTVDDPKQNHWDGVQFDWRETDPVRAAAASDRLTYLPGDLLTKVDRASMLHGLEVRSPFMDHELVQFAAGLTTDQLLKGGPKRMLREAFAGDLPAWVFKRKKMGFAVPIGEWFRGELRAMLRDNLYAADAFARQHFDMKVVERLVDEHETQRVDHSQRLYALLMLELWWRTAR